MSPFIFEHSYLEFNPICYCGHSIRIFDFYYAAPLPYLYRQISHRHPYVITYTVLYIILLFILHYFTKTEPSVSIFLIFSNLICAYIYH